MANGRDLRGLFETWRQVLTEPGYFFQEMPVTGGLGAPLAFLVLCSAVLSLGVGLTTGKLGWALGILIWAIVKAAIGAAIILLATRSLFGGQADYEATFRACAYAAAPVVFLWIPVIKYFAALYTFYLLARGLKRVNGFEMSEALLSLIAAGVITICLVAAFSLGKWIPAYPVLR